MPSGPTLRQPPIAAQQHGQPTVSRGSAEMQHRQLPLGRRSCSGLQLHSFSVAHPCKRKRPGQPAPQCNAAAHSAAAAAAAVHSATAAVQSATAQLVSAVRVPPGRDTAAMLFAAAGAVAWVKLFDYFARHEMIEQVWLAAPLDACATWGQRQPAAFIARDWTSALH